MSARAVRIGRRNSTYQVLHSLSTNRQKRASTRTFLVEGVVPINRALAHGWPFAAVVSGSADTLSSWARDVIARAAAPIAYELSPELMSELSGKDEPSELVGVLQVPEDRLSRIPVVPNLLVAVADRLASPGNLGTLIRSCDAFGVHGLIVSGHAADLYDPVTVSASRGSLFAVPVVRVESPAQVAAWVADVRRTLGACRVAGADETAAVALDDFDLTQPTVAIFGNEARGLSRAYAQMCDAHVGIPMTGAATSLNVGVAASVVFYEALRQRRRAPRPSADRRE
jgi:tRNA G18 (ribose-2'-O)-methylase SpoU